MRKNGLQSTLVIPVLYTYSKHNYFFGLGALPVMCLFLGAYSIFYGSPPATTENGGEEKSWATDVSKGIDGL